MADYRRGRKPRGRRTRQPRMDFDSEPDFADDFDQDGFRDEDDYPEARAPRRRPPGRRQPRGRGGSPSRGRRRPERKSFFQRMFGSSSPPARGRGRGRGRGPGRMDWGAAEEEDYEGGDYPDGGGYDDVDDLDYDRPRRRRAPSREPRRRERLTLMDLCTPVFGYAALLPSDPGGIHPGYEQFRKEIESAIQRIESEAPEHGIDPQDVRAAQYAVCLFLDEQVAASEWSGQAQWASEPLGLMLMQEPEGGVNFFNKLEELGERQTAVKEIFLVCLSLGFRGKFAELEPTQQAARIGEIRQKLLRSIHPAPLDSLDVLFPEAYAPSEPLEDEVPPPPRWWVTASLGIVVITILVYIILYWQAGKIPAGPAERLDRMTSLSSMIRPGGTP